MVSCLFHYLNLLLELELLLLPHHHVIMHVCLISVNEVHSSLVELQLGETLGVTWGCGRSEAVVDEGPVAPVVLAFLELVFVRSTIWDLVWPVCFVLYYAWDSVLVVSNLASFLDDLCYVYDEIILHAVWRIGWYTSQPHLWLGSLSLLGRRRYSFFHSVVFIIVSSTAWAIASRSALTAWILLVELVTLIEFLDCLWHPHRLVIEFSELVFMVAPNRTQSCATLWPHL